MLNLADPQFSKKACLWHMSQGIFIGLPGVLILHLLIGGQAWLIGMGLWFLFLLGVYLLGERWVRWRSKALTMAPNQRQSEQLEVGFRGLPKAQRPVVAVVPCSEVFFWGIRSAGSRGSLWISSACFEKLPPEELREGLWFYATQIRGLWMIQRSTLSYFTALCVMGLPEAWRRRFFPPFPGRHPENYSNDRDGVRSVLSAGILFPILARLIRALQTANEQCVGSPIGWLQEFPFTYEGFSRFSFAGPDGPLRGSTRSRLAFFFALLWLGGWPLKRGN